jgi:MFS family permease
LLVGVVCLITLVAVEAMAITTVMPVVEAELGDRWLYGWVFSAFYLGNLVGVVVGGRAVDRFAPVGPMSIGVAVFVTGLVVGGLAPSMAVLVGGRLLQGVGAGVVPAVAYVCVGRGFPAELRPRVFAVMSTAWVVPSLISPLLASVVADRVGWRWVFLGLVPVTVVVAVLAVPALSLPSLRRPDSVAGADGPGGTPSRLRAVLLLALGATVLLGGFSADAVWVGLTVAAVGVLVLLPAFRSLTPAGTLRARPALPAAVLTRGVLTFAFFSAEAFVSLAMTSVRGTSTQFAGVVLASASLWWTAGSWLQARYSDAWGATRLVRLGGATLVVGAVTMLAALSDSVPVGVWLLGGALAGLGMGTAYSPLAVVTLGEAEPGHEGAATSALQMSDILGISLGTGIAGVLPLGGVFTMASCAALVVVALAPRLVRPAG